MQRKHERLGESIYVINNSRHLTHNYTLLKIPPGNEGELTQDDVQDVSSKADMNWLYNVIK